MPLWSWDTYAFQKFNSGEYQVVLRKELTKSDVANVGRIVLPKVYSVRFKLSVLCILGELWQLSTTPHDVCNCLNLLQKDAEASLPPLVQGDPLILQMDDMVLPVTWKFKYRYDIF